MNPRNKDQFNRQITVHFTAPMFQLLETVASRQKTSIGEVVRQAVRDYLDVQEHVIGSRSRMGSRLPTSLV
jgi:metal-responsive CopG/Arc/MetJ family transcriptional regulator